MTQVFLVAFGGALGSLLRYFVGLWTFRLAGPSYPWGTLSVNIAGCFLIGVLTELITQKFHASSELRLLLITGFLGGFTTFSAFSLDAIILFERGEAVSAAVYILASVGFSMLAVFLGLGVIRHLF